MTLSPPPGCQLPYLNSGLWCLIQPTTFAAQIPILGHEEERGAYIYWSEAWQG